MEGSNNPRIEEEKEGETQHDEQETKKQLELPKGFMKFSKIDKLKITMRKDKGAVCKMICGLAERPPNEYDITNDEDQFLFHAREESGCCWRFCCGGGRSFQMLILDERGDEKIILKRPSAPKSPVMTVETPTGEPIGVVKLMPSCCFTRFQVECPIGTPVALIGDPFCCHCRSCSDVPVPITNMGGEQIALITKENNSCNCCTRHFTTEFDSPMDVRLKTCLLGAVLAFDFAFYEK